MSYDLVFEGDGENVYIERGNEQRLGLTDYAKQAIYVHDGLSRERTRRTVAHELTHAYLEACCLSDGRRRMGEEEVCEFVAVWGPSVEQSTREAMAQWEREVGR